MPRGVRQARWYRGARASSSRDEDEAFRVSGGERMANDESPRFRPVDPKVRFPELERSILAFWEEANVFHRSLEQRADAPEWVFYDGPPTANAKPHIGHAVTRTFKDVYPRYRDDDRPPRPPQGRMGLPRAPGRDRGGEGDRDLRQARHRGVRRRRVQRAVPGVRAAIRPRLGGADARGSASGSTWTTPTGRWIPPTSSPSGGR